MLITGGTGGSVLGLGWCAAMFVARSGCVGGRRFRLSRCATMFLGFGGSTTMLGSNSDQGQAQQKSE